MDRDGTLEKRYSRCSPSPLYAIPQNQELGLDASEPSDECRSRFRRSPLFTCAIFIVFSFLILSDTSPLFLPKQYLIPGIIGPTPHSGFSSTKQTSHVPLEAHIMSKCPDARDCLRDLVVPAMERVVDKVEFSLSYIGKVDDNDTIHCMHGATECLGNMLSLCANDLYPDNPKISLGFSTCLIMSYQRIPDRDLVTQCALEHGIPFGDLNACVSEGGKGLDLLEASVQRSKQAGVGKSCTIRVQGQQWCVRDGGKWKDCDDGHEVSDLVAEVEHIFNETTTDGSIYTG